MAASCVLGRDSHCDVPRGYASFVSLPAALLADHFEPPLPGRRSRLGRVLNVAQGYASGAPVGCALLEERFERLLSMAAGCVLGRDSHCDVRCG